MVTDPPRGSPWDDPLSEAPLVFVDLEMTGLAPETDRVIEICAQRTRGDRDDDALLTLVKPHADADLGAPLGNAHIHGIAPGELAYAPSFGALADRLEGLLDGAVLVAHGAKWDVAFLEAELARAGRPRLFPHYLDTLTLTRRAFSLPSHRLSALCAAFGIEHGRAHRADADVRALRAVFRHVIGALAPTTARDLWHVRVGERHARPEVMAAAVIAMETGEPMRVRYRPSQRAPEDLIVRVTGVRTELDPPRVLGYLLPSRSRRELRADRILTMVGAEAPPQPPRRRVGVAVATQPPHDDVRVAVSTQSSHDHVGVAVSPQRTQRSHDDAGVEASPKHSRDDVGGTVVDPVRRPR